MKIDTHSLAFSAGMFLSFASLNAPAFAQTIPGVPVSCYVPSGISSCLEVKGKVLYPYQANLGTLEAFPISTVDVTFFAAGAVVTQAFSGALLWDVISASEVLIDPTIKNDILHKIVVVTGSDGYEAVFSLGEIDPSFGGAQIIIAYATSGQSIGSNGFAKLIIPGDKEGGRFVSNIVKIEVKSVDY